MKFDPETCNKCGKCCHASIFIEGKCQALRKIACKHLGAKNGETYCKVYDERFKIAPWCMTVQQAYEQKRLPKDCPYVKDDPNYTESTEYMKPETEDRVYIPVLLSSRNLKPWLGPTGD